MWIQDPEKHTVLIIWYWFWILVTWLFRFDYIIYVSWFCTNHVKGIVRINNLLGLLVDSFLLMFSENPIEEDEELVHSDSEREELEWAKRLL